MFAELLAEVVPGCDTFCGLHIHSPGEMENGQWALVGMPPLLPQWL